MANDINLFSRIVSELHIYPAPGFDDASKRTQRIVIHYSSEVALGRMDVITAVDRCIGDLKGRNYHPKLDQRHDVRL